VIAKLRGRVDSRGDGEVVLDVAGVGYLVFVSARTLTVLPGVGEAAELAIETHVREDHIHLYGFSSPAEREMFRLLLTVQGVGAKVGLAILSALSADEAISAIVAGDAASFRRAAGVGPKLAQRVVAELKDKLPALSPGSSFQPPTGAAPASSDPGLGDAISALVNLGYGRTEAFTVVNRMAQRLGAATPVGILIRESLKEMARDAGGSAS